MIINDYIHILYKEHIYISLHTYQSIYIYIQDIHETISQQHRFGINVLYVYVSYESNATLVSCNLHV